MPLRVWDVIKVVLVLGILPAQFYLSSLLAPSDLGSSRTLRDGGFGLMRQAENQLAEAHAWVHNKVPWLAKLSLQGLASSLVDRMRGSQTPNEDTLESPAREVLQHDYFGRGLRVRKQRVGISFRLGQMVRDRSSGTLGVVVGWDEEGVAPPEWYDNRAVSAADKKQPFYRVLTDQSTASRDGDYDYFLQSKIELVDDNAARAQFKSPQLSYFFEAFHENMRHFVAKKWLRKLYPKD